MSSKTSYFAAFVFGVAFIATSEAMWSQSFLEDWNDQTMQRMMRADFVSFDAAYPDWFDSQATPTLKTQVPELDELETALQPWAIDAERENRCVQSLLEGNMLRLQIIRVLQGLYAPDLERELVLNEIPSSFQWIPVLASSYNHAFRGVNGHAGLWGLSEAQALKEGIARSGRIDERMGIVESTRAAVAILDQLQRRFPMDPDRVLVGFLKGMPFASRWSGQPGYDDELDDWIALYRVVARFMVNLDAPDFESAWGAELTTWRPVDCPGEIDNRQLTQVLGMSLDVQEQLFPWWIGQSLPCNTFEEFEPYLPRAWADKWDEQMSDLEFEPASIASVSLSQEVAQTPLNSSEQANTTQASSCIEYEVKKGDTLYNLSKRFPGTTPESIAAKNGIGVVIKIGETLCIPRME